MYILQTTSHLLYLKAKPEIVAIYIKVTHSLIGKLRLSTMDPDKLDLPLNHLAGNLQMLVNTKDTHITSHMCHQDSINKHLNA